MLMPMDEIDQAIAREETLLTVIAELEKWMPHDKAQQLAKQLMGIAFKAAPYRPEIHAEVAKVIVRRGLTQGRRN
jgi:hypothetical protein